MDEQKMVEINLPKSIIDKIETRVNNSNFDSVQDYIIHILNQVLMQIEKNQQNKKDDSQTEFKEEADEEKIKERMRRLESLGYLD